MSSSPQPTAFGSIPYLALPTIALIMIVIGVAIATERREQTRGRVTPTPVVMTPTHVNPVVTDVCVFVSETDLSLIFACPKPIYEYGPK